jgi:hypothetical protein
MFWANRSLLLSFLFILWATDQAFSCTVLYCAKDGVILAGNNEDWNDPLTRLWIYTPKGEKHGWIKFGFESGFPQGGMNDQGVFWDGTAGPYLEMPYSESNKTLYPGALMQKIIEESANAAEATEILQNLYCRDQYRAQYLIGDALGASMIAEGDSILRKQGDYQVLTNFYQSNPDLGGYPCWRYETATRLLESCDTLTPYYVGLVLASTCQEGAYPTQYSNIYDLRAQKIYLFFYHNYEEYLVIDLREELRNGDQYYDIPSLFSMVRLLDPGNSDTIAGLSVKIRWSGLPGRNYRVICSTRPDLTESRSPMASRTGILPLDQASPLLFIPVIALSLMMVRRRNHKRILGFFAIIAILSLRCDREEPPETDPGVVEHSAVLDGLEPNTTYYWKIEARNGPFSHFATETAVRTFHTPDK